MAKTLIAFFSRADENYFGGSMKYIEVGNTEIVAGKIKNMIDADIFKDEDSLCKGLQHLHRGS